MKHFLFLVVMIGFSACTEKSSKGIKVSKETENLEIEMQGIYQAVLSPVNSSVSEYLNGSLTLVREGDEFLADVRLSGGPKSVLQAQSIHIGTRCPEKKDDLNNDGYIDGEEGAQVYKETLIPLDDDLGSQRIGLGIYPFSDNYGFYFWSRAVKFTKMLDDLREEDINLTDDYVKIGSDKSLNVVGKVVVIRGVPLTWTLPDTVWGRGRSNPHESLPVACGIIKKLTTRPGVIYQDTTNIPVPEGETVGGSGGADDGADFPEQTSTGGAGNYGEDEEAPDTTDNSTEFGNTTGGLSEV